MQYAKMTYEMTQLLQCIGLQRCADLDTTFNIRFLSISVKNYPYPYPLFSLMDLWYNYTMSAKILTFLTAVTTLFDRF